VNYSNGIVSCGTSSIGSFKVNNHHHKHQGLGHLARSVSKVTAALSSVSSVSQLFSFLVDCSGTILKGFGVVAFFAGVRVKVNNIVQN
jgi:hypothetical protein